MSDPTLPRRFEPAALFCLVTLRGATPRSAGSFRLRQTNLREQLSSVLGYVGQVRLRRSNLREQPSWVLGYVGQVRLRQTNPYEQLLAILGYVGQHVRQASTSRSF